MQTINLETKLWGQILNNPLYNASGVYCQTLKDLLLLNESESGAIISKSCTLENREGNAEPRCWSKSSVDLKNNVIDVISINSMGLPNYGVAYYLKASTKLSKPYAISISGLKLEENLQLVEAVCSQSLGTRQDSMQYPIAALELNLSCPNIIGKAQTGYDFKRMEYILEQTTFILDKYKHIPFGIKLPPYFDMAHFQQAANIIMKFEKHIQFVTCINSIGNGLIIDPITETTIIHPKNGFGGIGGSIIKPTALANVRKFYELLPSSIDIIGCGGVVNGQDVFEHILCGAKAVQIGSILLNQGPDIITKILNELRQIMKSKGYTSLDQFRGKLKTALGRETAFIK